MLNSEYTSSVGISHNNNYDVSNIENNNNNNNNNNKVYTPLSKKCSQSRVFISQCHMNHIVQYYAY